MAGLYVEGYDVPVTLSAGLSQVAGRFGGLALHGSGGGSPTQIDALIFPSAPSTIICGFAFRFAANPGASTIVASLRDGSNTQVGIAIDTTGHPFLFRTSIGNVLGTATNPLAINTWVYLILKVFINNTTGTFDLKVDGTVVITGTGDTQNTATTADRLVFLNNSNTMSFDVDDVSP